MVLYNPLAIMSDMIFGRNARCLANVVSMAMSGLLRAIDSSSGWRSFRMLAIIACAICCLLGAEII